MVCKLYDYELFPQMKCSSVLSNLEEKDMTSQRPRSALSGLWSRKDVRWFSVQQQVEVGSHSVGVSGVNADQWAEAGWAALCRSQSNIQRNQASERLLGTAHLKCGFIPQAFSPPSSYTFLSWFLIFLSRFYPCHGALAWTLLAWQREPRACLLTFSGSPKRACS